MNLSSPTIVIQAGKTEHQYWRDLWRYRELFYFLAWRDLLVRYKQTVVGVLWGILRPLMTMIIFTVVFSKLAKVPSEGTAPYAIMVGAATLPWQFFSSALSDSSGSVVANSSMISKVFFPRLIIPFGSILVNMVDFLISFVILLGLMVFYRFLPGIHILFLPLFILMAAMAALGVGLWFSALTVKYRDVRFVTPFILQLGLYVSPVGYSSTIVPEKWRLLYSINPMVGVIDGFRFSILGNQVNFYWPGFILSLGLVVVLLAGGIWYFRKTERTFADVI